MLDVENKLFAQRLGEVKAGKAGKTLKNLKAASQVETPAPTQAETKTVTAGKILINIEEKALVNTLADALPRLWWPRNLRTH